MDPWEREYEAAFRACKEDDLATAEQHIRTAYNHACRQDSAEARAITASGWADICWKAGRRQEAERYCREAISLFPNSARYQTPRRETEELLRRIQAS